ASELHDYKTCKANFRKAYEIFLQIGEEKNAYAALGTALEMDVEMGHPQLAYEGLLKVYKWQKSQNDDWGLIISGLAMGEMYIDLKEYKKAEEILLEAQNLSEKFNAQYLVIDVKNKLSKLYFLMGESKLGEE